MRRIAIFDRTLLARLVTVVALLATAVVTVGLQPADAQAQPVPYQVADINPGVDSSSPSRLFAFGNRLLFQANDGTNGTELWISDGTAAGTVLLADTDSTPGGSGSPTNFTALGNNRAVFSARYFISGFAMR